MFIVTDLVSLTLFSDQGNILIKKKGTGASSEGLTSLANIFLRLRELVALCVSKSLQVFDKVSSLNTDSLWHFKDSCFRFEKIH